MSRWLVLLVALSGCGSSVHVKTEQELHIDVPTRPPPPTDVQTHETIENPEAP